MNIGGSKVLRFRIAHTSSNELTVVSKQHSGGKHLSNKTLSRIILKHLKYGVHL